MYSFRPRKVAIAIFAALTVAAASGCGETRSSAAGKPVQNQPNPTTDGVTVGGAKMIRTNDMVANAVLANNVSTTVKLVKLAGLVDTLEGPGPFTVFAPDNGAFAKLDPAGVAALQKTANTDVLERVLKYHVVFGTYTTADLRVMAQHGKRLKTLEGHTLTPEVTDGQVSLRDARNRSATIETADAISSNGVTHVIDTVLMP